jgi:hypothetical protein
MRYSFLILTAIVLFSLDISAQRGTGDRMFMVDATHRSSGWFLGAGATFMFPEKDHKLTLPVFPDSGSYLTSFDPAGRLGFALEGGMFWVLQNRFFDYVDLGITYRQLRGKEDFTAELVPGSSDTLPLFFAGGGEFQEDVLGLSVNLNKAFPLDDKKYIIQGLGADVEYRLINDYSYVGGLDAMKLYTNTEDLQVHLHYKLGFGYKTSATSWLSLTAETPIENLLPFEGLVSRRDNFNSRYRPVVFTLRYMWLRKRPARECPTAGPNPKMKKKRSKGKRSAAGGQVR